jgi:hypothetical protein
VSGIDDCLLFSLKIDQNRLGFDRKELSSELKKCARLSFTIFFTVARCSLNLARRFSVGANLRRIASWVQIDLALLSGAVVCAVYLCDNGRNSLNGKFQFSTQ